MTEAISPDLKIEPFGSHHNRAGFACGVESLDRYFKTQANQDVKRKINGVFGLVDPHEPTEVLGYYTLYATALEQGDIPVAACKHIPRYPLVSATLVGVWRQHRPTMRPTEGSPIPSVMTTSPAFAYTEFQAGCCFCI